VESVIDGFSNGDYPPADLEEFRPTIQDNHGSIMADTGELKKIVDWERETDRFSPPFTVVMHGLNITPLGLVPKPKSVALHLITDHSTGSSSLNSYFAKDDIQVRYDNII
jgi:hypothetical protein